MSFDFDATSMVGYAMLSSASMVHPGQDDHKIQWQQPLGELMLVEAGSGVSVVVLSRY